MSARGVLFLMLAMLTCNARAFGVEDAYAPDADNPPLQLRIWYPAQAGKPDALGSRLPLIVVSHGAGGTITEHVDTAEALAEAGFVVVAVLHTGNNFRDQSGVQRGTQMTDRPRHVVRTVDYMLTRWRAAAQLDAHRVGVFGFSAGGFTALVVAGAEPDLSTTATHCREQPGAWDCEYLRRNGVDPLIRRALRAIAWLHDPRVRAIVVAAPAVGYAFDAYSVRNVHVPTQLWGGSRDVVVGDSAPRIHELLPTAEYHAVADASHFSFLAPCDAKLRAIIEAKSASGAEAICSDAAGFDRSAFHTEFNRAVVAFYREHLQ